jgi:hypothetical protein
MTTNPTRTSLAEMLLTDIEQASQNNPERKITICVWGHGKLTGGDDNVAFKIKVKGKNVFVDKEEGVIFTRVKSSKKGKVTYKSLPIQDIRKVKFDLT